jgi:Lon protease-like protein
MLRRAIETETKQFGMCMYSEKTPYHYTEYGCMLEIKTCQFIRDGRAVVSTVGGRRFKVIRSSTKDGYNVAQVEWVKDVKVEKEVDKIGN